MGSVRSLLELGCDQLLLAAPAGAWKLQQPAVVSPAWIVKGQSLATPLSPSRLQSHLHVLGPAAQVPVPRESAYLGIEQHVALATVLLLPAPVQVPVQVLVQVPVQVQVQVLVLVLVLVPVLVLVLVLVPVPVPVPVPVLELVQV